MNNENIQECLIIDVFYMPSRDVQENVLDTVTLKAVLFNVITLSKGLFLFNSLSSFTFPQVIQHMNEKEIK